MFSVIGVMAVGPSLMPPVAFHVAGSKEDEIIVMNVVERILETRGCSAVVRNT